MHPREAWILFPGALGDTVCLEPAVAHLAGRNFSVVVFARGAGAEVAELFPSRPRVSSIDAAWMARLFAPLGAGQKLDVPEEMRAPKLILSFTGAGHAAVEARLAVVGARAFVFPGRMASNVGHAADFFLRAAVEVAASPALGRLLPAMPRLQLGEAVPPPTTRGALAPSPAVPRLQLEEVVQPQAGLLVLHPGSGGAAKRAPDSLWRGLIERWRGEVAGAAVEILLGPAEEGEGGEFWAGIGLQVVRPRDVRALAWRVARAEVFIGNDAGPSHVAAGLGVSTIVLFGSTDPRTFGPRGKVGTVTEMHRDPAGALASASALALTAHRGALNDAT